MSRVQKSTMAAMTLLVLAIGIVDTALNGGNPGHVLRLRLAGLLRPFLPSRAPPNTPAPVIPAVAEIFRSTPLQQFSIEPPDTKIVADSAAVIGVSLGDQDRAYVTQVMMIPSARVICDVIGGTQVAVIYRPIDDHARVLAKTSGIAGFVTGARVFADGTTDIEIDGRAYGLDDADLPLDEVLAVRTTWGEWKATHHSSTVFGQLPRGGSVLPPPDVMIRAPGIRQAVHETTESAQLLDSTPVIGVMVADQYRAYVDAALCPPEAHVINDVMGDTAVTVTYCNITDQVRVFINSDEREPLDVSVFGFAQGKMRIETCGHVYAQDDPEIPLSDLNFVRTTWGVWKAGHPFTDVYTGISNQDLSAD